MGKNRVKSCSQVLMTVKSKFQTESCFVIPQREKTFNAPTLASITSFDSFHHRNVSSIYWITKFRGRGWSNVFESDRFHSILNKTKSKFFSTAILFNLVRVCIHVNKLQRQNKHAGGIIERCSFQRYQIYWYSIEGWGDMVSLSQRGKIFLFLIFFGKIFPRFW